jgi:L-rhamnose mutarotase
VIPPCFQYVTIKLLSNIYELFANASDKPYPKLLQYLEKDGIANNYISIFLSKAPNVAAEYEIMKVMAQQTDFEPAFRLFDTKHNINATAKGDTRFVPF